MVLIWSPWPFQGPDNPNRLFWRSTAGKWVQPQFFTADIHQEAEPQCLKKEKNEALFSVKESQTQEVSIREHQKGPNVAWQSVPYQFEPQSPLVGVAPKRRLHEVRKRFVRSLRLFCGQFVGELGVLLHEERDAP